MIFKSGPCTVQIGWLSDIYEFNPLPPSSPQPQTKIYNETERAPQGSEAIYTVGLIGHVLKTHYNMGTIPLKNMCKIFAHRKTDYNNIFKEKKCCRELEFETQSLS